jgi:hypothetical protein
MKLFLSLLVLLANLFAQEIEHTVVYSMRTGNLKTFDANFIKGTMKLHDHYAQKNEKLISVVVISGEAYRFFLKDLDDTPYSEEIALIDAQKDLAQRLALLAEKYDVRFEVCSLGMKSRSLKLSNLYEFVHPIYSARSGLIEWQNRGYAYFSIQ